MIVNKILPFLRRIFYAFFPHKKSYAFLRLIVTGLMQNSAKSINFTQHMTCVFLFFLFVHLLLCLCVCCCALFCVSSVLVPFLEMDIYLLCTLIIQYDGIQNSSKSQVCHMNDVVVVLRFERHTTLSLIDRTLLIVRQYVRAMKLSQGSNLRTKC